MQKYSKYFKYSKYLQNSVIFALLLIITLLMTSCGFHLRGSGNSSYAIPYEKFFIQLPKNADVRIACIAQVNQTCNSTWLPLSHFDSCQQEH